MSEQNLKKYIAELIQEVEKELEESTTTANVDGYQTPHAFSRKKDKERRKKNATQLGYELVDNDVDNISEAIKKITSSQYKKLEDAIKKLNPKIKIKLDSSAPGGFEIIIPDDNKYVYHTDKVNALVHKITGDHRNGRIFFEGKKFKQVKKDKYGNHLEPQFKKGDLVTYLRYPAIITSVNKESGGVYSYNVDYNKGNGRTSARNIFNKSGNELKESVNESQVVNKKTGKDITKHVLDLLSGKINQKQFEKLTGLKKESVNEEETFTATNKETGKTSVFKSKETRDAAIKAGTHSKGEDKGKEDGGKKKGNFFSNLFNKWADDSADYHDAEANDRPGNPKYRNIHMVYFTIPEKGIKTDVEFDSKEEAQKWLDANIDRYPDAKLMRFNKNYKRVPVEESVNEAKLNHYRISGNSIEFYVKDKGKNLVLRFKDKRDFDKLKLDLDNPKDLQKILAKRPNKMSISMGESVNEAKIKRPVNRWLELKNDETMHPHKKMAMGLKELKYQLAETEKFFNWYNKIKTMNELDSQKYWKRTNNHIYKIKERLINIAKTLQEIEK